MHEVCAEPAVIYFNAMCEICLVRGSYTEYIGCKVSMTPQTHQTSYAPSRKCVALEGSKVSQINGSGKQPLWFGE